MKSVASFALGCKVNQFESEAIAEAFAKRGYKIVSVDEKADVYVINTCTVTNFGDKKSRQLIRRVKRQNPNAVVVAAGCYAQTAAEEVKKIEGVNIVFGTKNRASIVDEVERYSAENGIVDAVSGIMEERVFEPLSVHDLQGRTRAYIKIQDGCNQFCSYCIIPYARGPVRSRAEEDVLKEVRALAQNGFKEIVLTGIHVASYGKELKTTNLTQIIKKTGEIDGIERIRTSSVEPNIITEEFMEEMSRVKKLCHHFHLSLQSGCGKTLLAMNRKYTPEKYMKSVEIIRKYWPDAAITTDIIVGFPGETDEDFQESYSFAEKIGFSKIHVFPYSPKKGTPAEKMPNQIPNHVKSERSARLIDLSEHMSSQFIENFVGKDMETLFERRSENGFYEGHTSNYITVMAKSCEDIKNRILSVKIKKNEGSTAFGEIN
ncbi:MAG: tRNA (N(6)-L-threonylcarbamoyladenosine(37)-C(2))-methylthiotransferase MtaB [Firmicutes bacterium]|nr:tRNA (N(6)-L-threonylcarbamoyladenosine(37)-C(2))-methylthiotransferase MtaB [Bacillota bacterium]